MNFKNYGIFLTENEQAIATCTNIINFKIKNKHKTVLYISVSFAVQNSLMDSVREGEGGKTWENGTETCKISCMR